MKIRILFFLLFLNAFSFFADAQSVIIRPKKVVYTRKGKDVSKEKRTFDVTYPVISGAISAPVKKSLENTVSYSRVFETSPKENLEETWLYNEFYKVNYNKKGILDISLTQEGSGAYPDEQTVNLIIDLKKGKAVKFNDVFNQKLAAKLAAMVDKKLQTEKAKIIKDIDSNEYDNGESTKEEKETDKQMLDELKFTAENLNEFSIGNKGAIILYDAGFPHAWQALQPDGKYFFSWAQLKPFIRREGLLGKFIR